VNTFQFIAAMTASLALPVTAIVIALVFRRPFDGLIGRVRSVKALGAEGTFDPASEKAAVALATATTTAANQAGQAGAMIATSDKPTSSLLDELRPMDPQLIVSEAWQRVEAELRDRAEGAGIDIKAGQFGPIVIDKSERGGLVNHETAEALRGLYRQQTFAARQFITREQAVQYVTLADALLAAVKATQLPGEAESGRETAPDAPVGTKHP
jgi:hypothetical protein